ncbi:MAG: NADP-dependent oxidoreductase [Acetobacteraceae bacterium]|nr:NADP-dependent oxidoreductase [Acetobacteraceae bacterium]
MRNANRRIVLRARPTGVAGPEHFAEEAEAVRAPGPGEVLLETLFVSVDPAMRVWISENPGYVQRIEPGETMRASGIARVLESRVEGLAAGDLVHARTGWQSHPTLAGEAVEKLPDGIGSPTDWLGVLGTTGLTAFFGMRAVGLVRPGETVLVSGAAGGVGQIAGQVARIEACRVVGIAGGAEKCAWLRDELGYHATIDYKAEPDLAAAVARACPGGLDVFYDNVGGATLDAALGNLALRARVVICGRISQTAASELYGVRNMGQLIGKRARVEGFVVTDFQHRFAEGRAWLTARMRDESLRHRVHEIAGLERAPEALGMLFRGGNTGKLVVRVGA